MIHSVIITPRAHHSADLLLKDCLRNAGIGVKFVARASELLTMRPDLVINRSFGMDYNDSDLDILERLLQTGDLKTLNAIKAQRICRDKLLTLELADSLGLSTGRFFSLESFLSKRPQGRWALKTLRGMQGRGVCLNLSTQEIISRFKHDEDRRYIVQEQLWGEELRIMKLGQKLLCFKKVGSGNLRAGGKATLIETPAALEKFAIKLFGNIGLNFGAADFVVSGQRPLF